MKVTMIIGEPAVGKSTLMRVFMSQLGNWIYEPIKWVPRHVHIKNDREVMVLGRYDEPNHPYPGTDRMSMAAQPHAIESIRAMQVAGVDAVLFEGDRLGNDKMIAALDRLSVDLYVVHATSAHLGERQWKRTEQSDKFKLSRRTKIRNLTGREGQIARREIPHRLMILNNLEDTTWHAEWLARNRI